MSQTKEILKWMMRGNMISAKTAYNAFGCLRLASRIRDIRDAGIIIQSRIVREGRRNYSQYWIDKKTCEAYRKHKLAKS
jgi:hypothetical protein